MSAPKKFHINDIQPFPDADDCYFAVICDEQNRCVASLELGCIETSAEETRANAKLFAAAPETAAERDRLALELRSASKLVANQSNDLTETAAQRDELLAALKFYLPVDSDRWWEYREPVNSLEETSGPIFRARFEKARAAIARAEKGQS